MDPATVAGLVLAVIPLVISAVENYEVTFQPFVTYRRYSKEVERFAAKLDAQRAIFHNECQLLLLEVGQNLTDILREPNHPTRADEQLSKRLEELLGSSYATCVATLNLINDILNEVTEETRGFGDLIENKKSKGKQTFSSFRQRIKISSSKDRLTNIVNDLRIQNENLGRLSNQIRKLASTSAQPPRHAASTVTSHLKITQQASNRLYDLLASGWACDDRFKHVASMDLNVEEQSVAKVRFNLAVTCVQPSMQCKPLWLAIESGRNDILQEQPAEEPSAMLQATLQTMGATRGVRFALSTSTISTSKISPSAGRSNSLPGMQVDLCSMGKLCCYFRQLQSNTGAEPCVGFLEKTKTFKHFVYRHSAPAQLVDDSKSISLKQILQIDAEEKKERDWVEKLQLARLLALGVLRFHDTEWLPESWGSNNVRFIGRDEVSEHENLLDLPRLHAQLSNTSSRQIAHSNPSLARNETLFNLGVVLLELGYNAPFESLSQGGGDEVKNFFAARRLGESVHKKLNMTYRRLVEKCLNCNFGVAYKLDDTELQGAVVVQVVNQLDICLKQYKDFNSLAPIPFIT